MANIGNYQERIFFFSYQVIHGLLLTYRLSITYRRNIWGKNSSEERGALALRSLREFLPSALSDVRQSVYVNI